MEKTKVFIAYAREDVEVWIFLLPVFSLKFGNLIYLCLICVKIKCKMSAAKRIQVSFTEKQYKMLKNFKGEFGDSDAEIIRNIVMAWLAEKSFISETVKKKMNDSNE